MIDAKDMEILLTIQDNPLATLSDIASQINLSISNTSARLTRLEEIEKAFFGVKVGLNLSALELETNNFLIKLNSKKSLKLFENKFSYYHPYLMYRGRCNGKFPGLYLQFRTPKEGLNYLEELFGILLSKGILEDFEYIQKQPNEAQVRINSSLRGWDPKKQRWIFDWKTWKDNFENTSAKSIPEKSGSESILEQLSEMDIKLLSELTLDARRKNVDMMKNRGVENNPGVAQKVSRRIKFLKEKAISDYRIYLNWSIFDLYQTILIKGQCHNNASLKLRNYLTESKSSIPFQNIYFITDYGFLWYIRAPPSHLSELMDFIWDVCPGHELFLIDYKFTRVYGLWDQTFNAEKKKWKLNYEFMIDNVVKKIL
ncbi:MAG: winged helix-turn-helix transcriptional regulator [Candidatus Heimdallarchaeota archaeon]